ncbi:hypothetical protein I350_04901 [Cryptococcus amylolentus CBS 6273]|uniref:DUF1740-domain-containing protein n=1 Tax=Cryptococcus amylolentus CBS 6273 TaxID=1296118 RepID=A0A1E3JYC7_9TREE|nr:hypothetical protein I350_04901 [Cryptococcus amylolentus CBS 6273]
MASPPSFSSFPDLPAASSKAGQDPQAEHVPTFSSFPDLPKPSMFSRDDGHRQKRDNEREDLDKIDRRKRKDKEDGREERVDRRRRNRHGERERERSRSRERRHGDRHRHDKDGHRDQSPERRKKEERRRREREEAQALVRGDVKRPEERTSKSREREKSEERWVKDDDDGTPWYESLGGGKKTGSSDKSYDPSKALFLDTAGDRDIVRYGATTWHSAPRYHRDGNNRVMGWNEGIRVVYSRDRTQKGIELAPKGRPYVPRYHKHIRSATSHIYRILLPPSSDRQLDYDTSFVAFDSRPKRLEEPDLPSYRSITHQDLPDEGKGGEYELVEDAIGSFATAEQEVRKKTVDMERRLKEQPEDEDAWIEYSTLHLQLSPEAERVPGVDQTRLATTKAQAEVTLSILSRALNATPENGYSIALHLAYIRSAEKIWPGRKVTERWKNVLRELGQASDRRPGLEEGMMKLWLGYIEWREGQGFGKGDGEESGGGVDEVVDVYVECIERLKNGMGGDALAREENLVYLFLRACLFIKQAGYQERALAAFQALMEITFFKPDHLRHQPHPSQREAWFTSVTSTFEEFWDSEAPRIGEPGSTGWRNTPANTPPPPSVPRDPLVYKSEDPYERWLETELRAETLFARPGRATDLDDELEDDPFHIVVFSDLSPFLFPIFSPEVRLQLIYAFLTFLGLPFTPPGVPSTSPANVDPHFQWLLAANQRARMSFWPPKPSVKRIHWQTVAGEPMDPERPLSISSPFSCPVKNWAQTRSTLFAKSTGSGAWFRDLERIDLEGVDVEVVREVFRIMGPLVPDPGFTLAGFAVEAALSPKNAIKAAKSILSQDRTNLLLWDGYARLERQRGNASTARTVYITALQAAKQEREGREKTEDEMDLWAGWAEMEFEEGDKERCLDVVVMAAGIGEDSISKCIRSQNETSTPSPLSLLKTRQYYHRLAPTGSALLLSSLLTYLVDGIDTTCDALLNIAFAHPTSSGECEEALQLLSQIMFRHATFTPSTPAYLSRHVLERALGAFPNNTALLSLYMYGELHNRVYGRVQRLIGEMTAEPSANAEGKGVVGYLWAVWAEAVAAHRTFWDAGGGGAERVRMALDKGINSSRGRYCAALWTLYIEFEVHMGRAASAKQLCYRAVASLGACKGLYLLPFSRALRPHFSGTELAGWTELAIERGLRVRDASGLWDTDGEEEMVSDGGSELGFLAEREMMKPY